MFHLFIIGSLVNTNPPIKYYIFYSLFFTVLKFSTRFHLQLFITYIVALLEFLQN